jgi:hypothetical protein
MIPRLIYLTFIPNYSCPVVPYQVSSICGAILGKARVFLQLATQGAIERPSEGSILQDFFKGGERDGGV